MTRFKHDDEREVPLAERLRPKYEDVDLTSCETRAVEVSYVQPHYRTTIEGPFFNDRYFALGIEASDLGCIHRAVGLDRFGVGRCDLCGCFLFNEGWVADGVFGDKTHHWAANQSRNYGERLARPRLVGQEDE